jgi:chromosome segregation ATPase
LWGSQDEVLNQATRLKTLEAEKAAATTQLVTLSADYKRRKELLTSEAEQLSESLKGSAAEVRTLKAEVESLQGQLATTNAKHAAIMNLLKG